MRLMSSLRSGRGDGHIGNLVRLLVLMPVPSHALPDARPALRTQDPSWARRPLGALRTRCVLRHLQDLPFHDQAEAERNPDTIT